MLLDGQLNRERNPFFSFILNVVYHFEVMRTLWIDILWHASLRRVARPNIIPEANQLTITQPKSSPSFAWKYLCTKSFLDAGYFRRGLVNLFLPWDRYLAAKYEHHGFFFSFGNLHSHFIRRAGLVEVHLLR